MDISSTGSRMLSTYIDLGDPVAMADVAVMEMASDQRRANRAERRDAQQSREHELDAQADDLHSAAITKLVTGLVSSTADAAQAGLSCAGGSDSPSAGVAATSGFIKSGDKMGNAIGGFIESEFERSAKQHERAAETARARIDDAHESIQQADSRSDRVLGRMGETLQSVAQTRLALAGGLRA